ncbi:MAG: metallophosphoesterase family protein [Phycisphaerae bacterium]|jgi:putative phosphoesterase|nr:metallophosphoesterase family protein [Phycisphaerae bacterium]
MGFSNHTVVGVLSDSHGQCARVRVAIELLRARGASLFLHLGDVGDGVLDELAGFDCHLVFGNCDDPRSLDQYARDIGLHVHHPGGIVDIDGKRVGFTHGHLVEELERLFVSRVDYILHGHTHERSDAMVDGIRVINPGALHRARPLTVALFTPATGCIESIVVT